MISFAAASISCGERAYRDAGAALKAFVKPLLGPELGAIEDRCRATNDAPLAAAVAAIRSNRGGVCSALIREGGEKKVPKTKKKMEKKRKRRSSVHILVVGDGHPSAALSGQRPIAAALSSALVEPEACVSHWDPFALAGVSGSGMELPPASQASSAVVRFPYGKDRFALLIKAVAARCRRGKGGSGTSVLVCGTAAEGMRSPSVTRALRDAGFLSVRTVSLEETGATVPEAEVVLLLASRRDGKDDGSDDDHIPQFSLAELTTKASPFSLPLGRGCGNATMQDWTLVAGLFAGGGLDVMTGALLSELDLRHEASRLMDFGCGSGAIGAALRLRFKSAHITMVDVDAIALVSARANIEAVEKSLQTSGRTKFVCSDCFDRIDASERFDAIVSNVPVHETIADSYRVCAALVAGAAKQLVPGGELWIVSQSHCPVGHIIEESGCLRVTAARSAGGARFVVWRAEAAEAGRISKPATIARNKKQELTARQAKKRARKKKRRKEKKREAATLKQVS